MVCSNSLSVDGRLWFKHDYEADDKALAEKSKNGDYSEAADFDRNGKTDSADMKVFDGIYDKTVPTKM